ncbi:hypothetical protein J7E50_19095 [Pedobacter sp. ISL-68]|uniref:hypothetical protein n=1 Tax=unclassified Pedobacter TaxID=2628915 RepID=UPI001BE823E7|nr:MULTISPECIES: hypothetical protein [unclassified Pedobacter]MBT2560032.1 hypothetical protein [Pedobacter sp. ISL-64]MBT2592336.1 hypothetical protein [Pedobacter sp. ISL-68]
MKFLPVLRFYASLPRTSLLQGNTSTGAIDEGSISFVGLQDAETLVPKPDCNVKPTVQRGLEMSGTVALQEPQANHFLILKPLFHLECATCT